MMEILRLMSFEVLKNLLIYPHEFRFFICRVALNFPIRCVAKILLDLNKSVILKTLKDFFVNCKPLATFLFINSVLKVIEILQSSLKDASFWYFFPNHV